MKKKIGELNIEDNYNKKDYVANSVSDDSDDDEIEDLK